MKRLLSGGVLLVGLLAAISARSDDAARVKIDNFTFSLGN